MAVEKSRAGAAAKAAIPPPIILNDFATGWWLPDGPLGGRERGADGLGDLWVSGREWCLDRSYVA
jgi:hypothetical protein